MLCAKQFATVLTSKQFNNTIYNLMGKQSSKLLTVNPSFKNSSVSYYFFHPYSHNNIVVKSSPMHFNMFSLEGTIFNRNSISNFSTNSATRLNEKKSNAHGASTSNEPEIQTAPAAVADGSEKVEPVNTLKTEVKKQTTKEKLKQAVKDYGLIVIGFHITISLMSLGFFYLLVSSGVDWIAIMRTIGISESLISNRITQGASTFALAYAVHKIFAPARIAITLSVAPLIVNRLRKLGILKKVK